MGNASKFPILLSKSPWLCLFLCCRGLFGRELLVPDEHLGSPLPSAGMPGEVLAGAERRSQHIRTQQNRNDPSSQHRHIRNSEIHFFWGVGSGGEMKVPFHQGIFQHLCSMQSDPMGEGRAASVFLCSSQLSCLQHSSLGRWGKSDLEASSPLGEARTAGISGA